MGIYVWSRKIDRLEMVFYIIGISLKNSGFSGFFLSSQTIVGHLVS